MTLMLKIFLLILFTTCLSGSAVNAQDDRIEQEIRKLDLAEAEAILHKDFKALNRLLAEDFTVNSPRNVIVKGRKAVEELVRNGVINYSSFVREIEYVLIHDGIAVVMGFETIKPIGKAQGSGQTIRRRFTNIWSNKGGNWLLTARHANVICEE